MKPRILLIIITFVTVFFSCGKKDNGPTGPENTTPTTTILIFQNNSDCLIIAEIDISSTSYTKRIYLSEMLFQGESVSDTLINISTGNYAIKFCCATNWIVGIVNGVFVNTYNCSMSNQINFDITEGEENIITFN